jgi:prepilin-type processing-associated H-X9-DG protein
VAAGGDYAASAGIWHDYGDANTSGEAPGNEGGVMYSFSRNSIRNVSDGTAMSLGVGEKYLPTEDEARQMEGFDENRLHYFQRDTAFFSGDNINTIMSGTECGLAHGSVPTGAVDCDVNKLREQFGSDHPSICNFVFLDGHVQALQQSVDGLALQRLSSVADDQVVDTSNL